VRTKLPHILPGCPYCDSDHDPSIRCRALMANPTLELNALKQAKRTILSAVGELDPRDPAREILCSAYAHLNNKPSSERPGFNVDYALEYGPKVGRE
jgi:hypothetical protein